LDEIEIQLKGYLNLEPEVHKAYAYWLSAINHEDCKRVAFDSAQAQQFAPLVEFPATLTGLVRPPFDVFWMEFTDPVAITADWGVTDNDYLRGLLYADLGISRKVCVAPGSLIAGVPPKIELRKLAHLVLFFHDPVNDVYTDRNWLIDLSTGKSYVTRHNSGMGIEARLAPTTELMMKMAERDAEKHEHDRSTGLRGVPEERDVVFEAGWRPHGMTGHIGWWERQALTITSFLQWCLGYMMAKNIVVEVRDVPISRQVRRQLNRKGLPMPKPWHVVMVDPKYVRTIEDQPGDGGAHSYRYDVIGHVRIGRHRIGQRKDDGTYAYKQTLEWVAPHQRGLSNDLYIPKTYAVAEGRKVPAEVRRAIGPIEVIER
jgi:hypothetical protein